MEETIECLLCKEMIEPKNWKSHINNNHNLHNTHIKCDCTISLSSNKENQKHIESTHTQIHITCLCGETFLRKDYNKHSLECSIECPECGRTTCECVENWYSSDDPTSHSLEYIKEETKLRNILSNGH